MVAAYRIGIYLAIELYVEKNIDLSDKAGIVVDQMKTDSLTVGIIEAVLAIIFLVNAVAVLIYRCSKYGCCRCQRPILFLLLALVLQIVRHGIGMNTNKHLKHCLFSGLFCDCCSLFWQTHVHK